MHRCRDITFDLDASQFCDGIMPVGPAPACLTTQSPYWTVIKQLHVVLWWLLQYYLGIAEQLQQMNILQPHTQLAGASAGSLIAACVSSGLPLSTIRDACFELARDCRDNGTRHRLGPVLQGVLQDVLPDDVAARCSGKTHIAVTLLAPRYKPRMVSKFRNRSDLIAALMTSCHIPW